MGSQDKPTRESGVWRPLGGEGAAQRADGDDDVEGHKFMQNATGQRASGQRIEGDDDVEGHKLQERAAGQRGTPDDDDVEGHKQSR